MANNSLATRARPENEHYIATIAQPSSGLNFRGWVPDQFSINIQNSWEPVLGGINEISQAATRAAQVTGVIPNLKELTRQVWIGTGPLDFHLTFMLDTYEDSFLDVQSPINDLIRMATPTRSGALLYSPGPTLLSDEKRIYLRVGKAFYLDSIIITDIDVTYYTVSDVGGQYQAADVNIGMRTHYTPDQSDILRFFSQARNSAITDNPIFNNSPLGRDVASYARDAYTTIRNGIGAAFPNRNFDFPEGLN